jgi:serine/threonine-protein kinase
MGSSGIALAAGREITPSLRLVREIGKGGMGSVWIADHLALRTQVAVKFLSEKWEQSPQAVARFSAEAAAAARVRSPHVAQVFDHGFSDGVPYIVMELLEGEDLAARLAREGRLPAREVLAIARHVGKALEKAHAQGIIHRDIKPANIFLVAGMGETFVKVLDFGLAKHTDGGPGGMTESLAVFGTPHYVSPEQAESARGAGPQSDLWSLAVVVFECLTGVRPFQADSLMGLCIALYESRFPPATSLCAELPAAMDAWCERAFQREPQRRFAGASELVSALAGALADAAEGLAGGGGESAGDHERRTKLAHRRSRKTSWKWIAGVAAAASIAPAFGAWRAQSHKPPIAPRAVDAAPIAVAPAPRADAPEPVATPTQEAARTPPPAVAADRAPANGSQVRLKRRHGQAAVAAPGPRGAETVAASSDDLFSDPKN